jgi:ComF family protein
MSILTDLFFPKKCVNCRKTGKYICSRCLISLRKAKQVCFKCRKPSIDGFTHAKCFRKKGVDGLYCAWYYEGVARKAILSLKYKFVSDLAEELVEEFVKNLKSSGFVLENTALVPIPMHTKRKNFRGFNQTEILGELVSKKLKLQLYTDLLKRKIFKAAQTDLSKDKRKKNIKNNFSLNMKVAVQNKTARILLFDDVYTTGSTIKECTKVLKRGGFGQVFAICLCRSR